MAGTSEASETLKEVRQAFFEPIARMQATLAILCDGQQQQSADPVTQTVLTMLACPVHVQLTAIGWQPFKGKELTFPYQQMSSEQKEVLKRALLKGSASWNVYEHALTHRIRGEPLRPLDVLEALCATILASTAYADRRLRVAVCNILLQRVQASIPLEKATLRTLNARLFPCPETAST